MTTTMKPRVTSFAPQFLVDDLERSIEYYEKLGFTFGAVGWLLRHRPYRRTGITPEGSAEESGRASAPARQ